MLDREGKEAIFHQLSVKYNWMERKKEKMEFLIEIEDIILPRLGIEPMHRKSLIRKLRNSIVIEDSPKRGRKPKYNDFDKHHLKKLWELSGHPCSKRLKTIIKDWLPYYECPEPVKKHLLEMSPSQMDEYLRTARQKLQQDMNKGTIPAKAHIKKLIRLRDPSIRYTEPGYTESDTVLHCGDRIWGTYAHSVSLTDLYSGWTCGRSILGKNAIRVIDKIKDIKSKLPFEMKSLFFDNGIEFVNHLLVDELKTAEGIDVARGRSGKSNDQCHIEQKNNTFIRQVFGHQRIESKNIIDLMNDIYENYWEPLHNYFLPQMKLISKDKVGSKTKKKYDQPKTPYERLMSCETLEQEFKQALKEEKEKLNPLTLQAGLQKKLVLLNNMLNSYNEEKDALC